MRFCDTPSPGACGGFKAAECSHSSVRRARQGCKTCRDLHADVCTVCPRYVCLALCVCLDRVCLYESVCVLCVMLYMWGGGGVLCLGGVSASGCLSLSIP